MLELANIDKTAVGGVDHRLQQPVYKLVQDNMSTTSRWIVLVVVLGGLRRGDDSAADRRRRRKG